ncbi:MAG: hypothetical protein P1U58_08205 [Verrucomicrobiales bacterium]|nr:hypothetical protein [Verrucomicrobiales bacterium]
MKKPTIIILALASFLLLSCSGEKTEVENSESVPSSSDHLATVFLSEAPGDAITVVEARSAAVPGESLIVAGKIAGVMNPFTEGYASLVLADESLQTCDLIPGDECPTPWDACCVAPEELKAQRITIQVPGENGLPVAESLKGVNGLAEMDALLVTGTVNENSTGENLILDLNGIYQK